MVKRLKDIPLDRICPICDRAVRNITEREMEGLRFDHVVKEIHSNERYTHYVVSNQYGVIVKNTKPEYSWDFPENTTTSTVHVH